MEAPIRIYTLEEALEGTRAPAEVRAAVTVVTLPFVDFSGVSRTGQLVVARDVAEDVKRIFETLHDARFPIEKMEPIVAFGWDDHDSIRANNTSSFNYRVIEGTKTMSWHSLGRAIDLNPRVNPFFVNGESRPPGFSYRPDAFGAVRDADLVVRAFLERGWEWGGYWKPEEGMVDYQHFQKR
ncbi:MAG: hypothetical protein RLZZ324_315 [Candidatus Parcubacteria bacterium]|jgi:poly-gamma-glutamate synthesis protein (capsule biosynthesis protein)